MERVAPVQIFQHHHHGDLGRQNFQRVGDFAQHALAGGAEDLVAQLDAVFQRDQRGHVQEPRGRAGTEVVHEAASESLAELIQSFKHRQVRLAATELLETSSAGGARRRFPKPGRGGEGRASRFRRASFAAGRPRRK